MFVFGFPFLFPLFKWRGVSLRGHYFISFFSFDFFFFDSLSFDINFSFDDCIVLGVLQSFFFHHSFVSLSILSRQVNSKAANIHHYYGRFFSVLTSPCPMRVQLPIPVMISSPIWTVFIASRNWSPYQIKKRQAPFHLLLLLFYSFLFFFYPFHLSHKDF